MQTLPSSIAYQMLPTRLPPPHLTHYNDFIAQERLAGHIGCSLFTDGVVCRATFTTTMGEVRQSTAVEQLCSALLEKLVVS